MNSSTTAAVYAKVIAGLHSKWTPHSAQIPVGRKLLFEGCKDIFIEAGRSWGKTELMAYLLWRWAMSNPGSESYYFSPYMKQAREILWASRRIQSFGLPEWLASPPNNTEMRINLKNQSFIKLDGSDNVESYRGVKPRGLVIFDEFKDFRQEFYEAFDPNRAAHNAPLIIIGTPPDRDCQFSQLAELYRTDPEKAYFHAPTSQNPHISKDWLSKKRAELYAREEGDVWEREYEARFIKGGASKIFPMVDQSIVRPHAELMREIQRDRRKLEWYLITDPAAISCFAVLLMAVNQYTKKVYFLDEIYETDQAKMTVKQIGRSMFEKRDAFGPGLEWYQVYDEAEAWFAAEVYDHFQEHFIPTRKALHDKESGLSLIKDIILNGSAVMSDRCAKLYWEMDNYFKDKNGNIPKKHDHLIDCVRYGLSAANYELKEKAEYIESKDENFRGRSISQDFPDLDDMGERVDNFETQDLDL